MTGNSNSGVALVVGVLGFALGVSVVATEAHALGFIDNEEDAAKCAAEGGNPVERDLFGDMTTMCNTPEKDAACAAERGGDYYYDYLKRECSNVPF